MHTTIGIAAAVAAALLCLPAGARGEVVDVTPAGFLSKHAVTIAAPPGEVYKALVTIERWWNPAHSYSGVAANLSLDARPGGCFCERLLGDGGVQHMSVVYVAPGRVLRMTGGLGPLQDSGLAGSMTWQLTAAGSGTAVAVSYSVGGYRQGGLDSLAPAVDRVVGEQLARLRKLVETGTADAKS